MPPSVIDAQGELCAVENKVPYGFSADEFVCVDEDVVHEVMTNEAIISNVCEADDAEGHQG